MKEIEYKIKIYSESAQEEDLLIPSEISRNRQTIKMLEEEWINQAIDRNANLGAYTKDDFKPVSIKLPDDLEIVLQLIMFEFILANPQLFTGEMTISGRTLRMAKDNGLPVEEIDRK
jgi:hypothetical protein